MLRLKIAHLFLALVILAVAGVIATAGALMLVMGLYHTLEPFTGRVASYAISGLTAIAAAWGLLVYALKAAGGRKEKDK